MDRSMRLPSQAAERCVKELPVRWRETLAAFIRLMVPESANSERPVDFKMPRIRSASRCRG
jgi:hypothetical protein